MKRSFFNIIRMSGLLAVGAWMLVSLYSCADDEKEAKLYFEEEEVTVEAQGGSISVILRSDSQWKITTTDTWFSYNITKGAASASIVFSFDSNDTGSIRSKEVAAQTLDGSKIARFNFRQLPSGAIMAFDKPALSVESPAGTAEAGITMANIDTDEVKVEITYADEDETGWITGTSLAGDKFAMTVTENTSPENKRVALVTLTYTDPYDRMTETTLTLTQMFVMDPGFAVEKDMVYVNALEAGDVAENIYVSGVVVAAGNGTDHNFKTRRYIIQDAAGGSFVFESDSELSLGTDDGIDLWLLGTTIVEKTEAGHVFRAATKVASLNILQQTPGQGLTVPELYMEDLTDEHINTLVTLKDVEVAIPFGGWVNYNSWYLAQADFTQLVRNHPTGVRDIKGGFMYALINTEAVFRYSPALPQGSGPLTGIVVHETNVNMGNIGRLQIRPRSTADIGLDNARANGFSEIVAEWDGNKPSPFVVSDTYLKPSAGVQTNAKFTKNNAPSLSESYNAAGHIYFIEDYRAGTKVTAGTINAANWGTEVWWLIYDISTSGITNPLSLQVETNSSPQDGPKNFVVEWSSDGTVWNSVAGGGYAAHGQTITGYRHNDYNPGFKCYNFDLPAEILGQASVWIRLRCAGTESVNTVTAGKGSIQVSSTNRIAHISIKYNK